MYSVSNFEGELLLTKKSNYVKNKQVIVTLGLLI